MRRALHNYSPRDHLDEAARRDNDLLDSLRDAYVPSTPLLPARSERPGAVKREKQQWKKRGRSQFTTHEPSANFVMNGFTRTASVMVMQVPKIDGEILGTHI